MNRLMLEGLLNFRELYTRDDQKTEYLLTDIEKVVMELIGKHEASTVEKIRNLLGKALSQEVPEVLQSYNLGKAHAIIEMIDYFLAPLALSEKAKNLPPLEHDVLLYLGGNGEATPSEIRDGLGLSSQQQVSNLLSQLRLKDLLHVLPIGKNRYYSLNPAGWQVYKLLNKPMLECPAVQNLPDEPEPAAEVEGRCYEVTPSNYRTKKRYRFGAVTYLHETEDGEGLFCPGSKSD